MPQPTVRRDKQGREMVTFTTRSGVVGIVDTRIPLAALSKLIRKLERRRRRMTRPTYSPQAARA